MEAPDAQHEPTDHVVYAFMSRLPHTNRAWLPTPGNIIFTLFAIFVLLGAQTAGAIPARVPLAAAPAVLAEAPTITMLAAGGGGSHTCALTDGGGVTCWGLNQSGQLGDGTTTDRSTPMNVVGLSRGVRALAAGFNHTCALTDGGGVKCWGANGHGQLGDGTYQQRSTPVDVVGLSNGVQALAAGLMHTCALTDDGGVKCWGHNQDRQLGDGTGTERTTPVDVVGLSSGVQALAAGLNHTCAVIDGGSAKCWGNNFAGQLGDGTIAGSDTPVDVVGLSSGVQALSAGEFHTCAITNDGGVMCWGNNSYGQLGYGTGTSRTTPVDVVGLSSSVQALAAGWSHTCALTEGGAKCWGANGNRQLGDGTTTGRTTPVDVVGLSGRVQALATGWGHTCALTEGGVMCWGDNGRGQLGDGTNENSLAPVGVVGLGGSSSPVAARVFLPLVLR